MKCSRPIEGNIILLEDCEPRRKINVSWFDGIHHDVLDSTNKVQRWYVRHN